VNQNVWIKRTSSLIGKELNSRNWQIQLTRVSFASNRTMWRHFWVTKWFTSKQNQFRRGWSDFLISSELISPESKHGNPFFLRTMWRHFRDDPSKATLPTDNQHRLTSEKMTLVVPPFHAQIEKKTPKKHENQFNKTLY